MRSKGRVRLEAEIDDVKRRLFNCEATVRKIMADYHVAQKTVQKIVAAHSTADQRHDWHSRTLARNTLKGRFGKGHVPWNKGRKGVPFGLATQFKKDCLRGMAARQWVAIGTISTWRINDKTGHNRPRKYIKVRDDGPRRGRWIALARCIWERLHGPVPPGMVVIHLNGDTLDCRPVNLAATDRRQQLLYQYARDPEHRRRLSASMSQANRLRHQRRRHMATILGKYVGVDRFWQCAACGGASISEKRPERCVKCGSASFERVESRRRKQA